MNFETVATAKQESGHVIDIKSAIRRVKSSQ